MARPVMMRLATYLGCAAVGATVHAAWTSGSEADAAAICPSAGPPTRTDDVPGPRCPAAARASTCPEPRLEPRSEPPEAETEAEAGLRPPEVPLPHMPGHRKRSSHARRDDERDSWLVVETYDIPAKLDHAVGFYEKAIVAAQMRLIRLPRTDEDGATRSVLRGRRDHAHVQISLRQAKDELLTRVRVMWRAWD